MPDIDLLCELLRKEAMIALEDGDYGKGDTQRTKM